MSKIYLDDNIENEDQFGKCGSLIDVALKVKEKANENDVLFIYVNFEFHNCKRAEQTGIELLIWLRLKEVMNHCVLYSFETVHALLNRRPQYLIATSKGTSFVQLPIDLEKMDLSELKEIRAEHANLKKCLKSAFSMPDFRHREANWWGVKCLWDVHRVATGGTFEDEYPPNIIANRLIINNAIAETLYEFDVISILKFIREFDQKIKKQTEEIPTQLSAIRNNQAERSGEIQLIQKWIFDAYKKINDIQTRWLKYYSNTSDEYKKLNNEINISQKDIQDFKTEFEIVDKELTSLKAIEERYLNQLNWLNQSLENIFQTIKDKLFRDISIPKIDENVKILLIDDNAANGWSDIFKALFNCDIKSIIPVDRFKDQIDELYNNSKDGIKDTILNFKPTLILLDLRLFDETGNSLEVKRMSGKLLLSKIKSDFKGLPVIITTASNKIWTYEELITSGADGYWIKEGLDENREATESIKNYIALVSLISKASDPKYQTLQQLIDFIETIERRELWWELQNNNKWKNGEFIDGNTASIRKILNDSADMIKQYLHSFHMGYGHKDKANEAFQLSGIIQKLCSVYEYVHGVDDKLFKICEKMPGGMARYLSNKRGDKNLGELRTLRNDAAHVNFEKLNWNYLEKAIDIVIKYINAGFQQKKAF